MILAFGQLLKLLVQTGLIGLGVVLLVFGKRKIKSPNKVLKTAGRVSMIIGVILIAPILVEIGLATYFETNTEWNPIIRSDEQILGTYAGGGVRLNLLSGRKYTLRVGENGQESSGDWRRDDWNLTLSGGGRAKEFRVITFRGKYRLREERRPMDPDEIGWWDIGLRRVSTSPTNSVGF